MLLRVINGMSFSTVGEEQVHSKIVGFAFSGLSGLLRCALVPSGGIRRLVSGPNQLALFAAVYRSAEVIGMEHANAKVHILEPSSSRPLATRLPA